MNKRIFNALALAAQLLLGDWRALIVLFVLYLAMLGAVYLFFVTREATVGQLILSMLLALAAPVLFLIIQTMATRYSSQSGGAWKLFVGSLRDFWKLLVIAVPLILVVVLAIYLFGKFDKSSPVAAVREALRSAPQRPVPAKPQPIHWQSVAITTLKYLLFFLALPLAAIHLWIETASNGLGKTIKSSPRILARALAPYPVLTYLIGFVFFAVVPYFLVVTRTQMTNAWLDFGLLTARLILAAALSLVGWVVTVGALGQLKASSGSERIAQPGEANAPAEA